MNHCDLPFEVLQIISCFLRSFCIASPAIIPAFCVKGIPWLQRHLYMALLLKLITKPSLFLREGTTASHAMEACVLLKPRHVKVQSCCRTLPLLHEKDEEIELHGEDSLVSRRQQLSGSQPLSESRCFASCLLKVVHRIQSAISCRDSRSVLGGK